jgi:hypothetical protein
MWGALLYGLSDIFVRLLKGSWPASYSVWHYVLPYPQLGAPIGSLFVGVILPLILNLRWGEKDQNAKSYAAFSDYLGLLFFNAQIKKKPVMVTLRNGKVYIGYINGCNTPGKHDGGGSVRMQPALSGYRRHVTHEMFITTDYTRVLESIRSDVESERSILEELLTNNDKGKIVAQKKELMKVESDAEERLDNFKLVLSISDIVSATIFDKSVYGQFNPAFRC